MKIKIAVVVISLVSALNAQAFVNNFGSSNYMDMNTSVDMDHKRGTVELNNYRTGLSQTVNVKKSAGGGYKSDLEYDYNTGRLFEIEVDQYGDVTRWNY